VVALQPEAVGDDEDRRQRHGGRGEDRVEVAERGERDGGGVVAEGPEQVLPHQAHGRAGDLDRGGDVEHVVADEDDIAGLFGHVGAGADRHADVGLGQRRGVVDAVADHRDAFAFVLKAADLGGFVLREDFGEHAIDPGLRRDRLGGAAVVAGDHHDFEA
jgi:hypothetical protein